MVPLKALTTLTLDLGGSEITRVWQGLEQLKALTTLTLDLGSSKIHESGGAGAVEGSHDAHPQPG